MSKTLGDVMKDLSFGHLSNLSIGDEGSGSIEVLHEDRVLSLINQGLVKLYTRFRISEKKLTLRVSTSRTSYPLKLVHADTDPAVEDKFIVDTVAAPFMQDILRVLEVKDPEGLLLPLNDKGDETSAHTPSPGLLVMPEVEAETLYEVSYQAAPVKLTMADLSAEIELPAPLFEALEAYVGYRVMSPMNGQEHTAKAMELMQLFEAICSEVMDRDLSKESQTSSTTKLESRGFV